MVFERTGADEMLDKARAVETSYKSGAVDTDVHLGRLYEALSIAPAPMIVTEPYRTATGIFNRILGDARRKNPRAFEKLDYVIPV